MTTLPPSPRDEANHGDETSCLERETRLELATPNLGKVVLYQLSYSRRLARHSPLFGAFCILVGALGVSSEAAKGASSGHAARR